MNDPKSVTLKRALSLPLVTLYGLGTVLGAGIYVLIGEVAARAGGFAPVSFLFASVLSALTAFCFAELAGRFPKSAGEAVYVFEGYGRKELSLIVGLMVAAAGIVSSAAIAQGFAGYLHSIIPVPEIWPEVFLILALTGLAAWGIAESVIVAAFLTVIEAGALVLIVVIGMPDAISAAPIPIVADGTAIGGIAILSGAVLAFYAFIGFEDMVNVVEEVRDPRRTMGPAIAIVVVVTTVLYVAVSFVAVRMVPPVELAASNAPMALLFDRVTHLPPALMSVIAMLAVVNGALIQIIMAARVLYGLADQGAVPGVLARVNPLTRTPLLGTVLVGVLVLVATLLLPLATLAEITSTLILVVFALVNGALVLLKRRGPPPKGVWNVPMIVPVLGLISSAIFAVFSAIEVLNA